MSVDNYLVFYIPDRDAGIVTVIRIMYAGRDIDSQLDYTIWQREYFDKMKPGEFAAKASAYADSHPYTGKAQVL